MKEFILKELVTSNIELELEKIGFDHAYIKKAVDKFQYKTIKIFDLSIPQANILKQTALTFGADCAVHRDVLVNKIDKTNVILGGSISQIKKICEKLKIQPFSLKNLSEKILLELNPQKRNIKLVGILNITPNSFSDGGLYFKPEDARRQLFKLIEDGADIIDIGAESTKPYSEAVPTNMQIERLKPLLKNLPNITISVDTRCSEVADFALNNGASIINDVSGGDFDSKMFNIVSKYNASIILQHSTGKSENKIIYKDIIEEIYLNLLTKINLAKENGIDKIIIDPGIGFGKSKEDNFEILNRIEEFYSLNRPLMIGLSRKSFLGIGDNNNELKDILSTALAYPLIQKNIDYLRVHNIKYHRQLINSTILHLP